MGLVERVRNSQYSEYTYYLTSAGEEYVERPSGVPVANRRTVEGTHGDHLKAVVDLGSFFAVASDGWRKDRFTYRNYLQEQTLKYGPKDELKVDAVLTYEEISNSRLRTHTRLIEIDRDTEPVTTLFKKVSNYVQWACFEPKRTASRLPLPAMQWQRDFPGMRHPPRIVFVFDCPVDIGLRRVAHLAAMLAGTNGWDRIVRIDVSMLSWLERSVASGGGPFSPETAIQLFPESSQTIDRVAFLRSDRNGAVERRLR